MSEQRPIFDQFKAQLEQLFGQPLAQPAQEAATDFWKSWDLFQLEIGRRGLSVHVDPFRLALVFPKYKRYHVWKGAGKALLLFGLVIVWFELRIGTAILGAGAVTHAVGSWYRFNDAKQFAELLMKEATLRPTAGGFAGLCFNYIAGTIQLATVRAVAHWPQHPSNAITGMNTRVAT